MNAIRGTASRSGCFNAEAETTGVSPHASSVRLGLQAAFFASVTAGILEAGSSGAGAVLAPVRSPPPAGRGVL